MAWWLILPLVTRDTRVRLQSLKAPSALELHGVALTRAHGQAAEPQTKTGSKAGNTRTGPTENTSRQCKPEDATNNNIHQQNEHPTQRYTRTCSDARSLRMVLGARPKASKQTEGMLKPGREARCAKQKRLQNKMSTSGPVATNTTQIKE